jgi:GNAT superfamily N-acetyltransferase
LATTGQDLTIRPVRPADRERVLEMTRDVWEGHDYLPSVFDVWIADAGSAFQAAEVNGVLVGLQRLRPFAPGLVWYEGLRVASTHRRQGLARAMLQSAIAEAKEQGFREMRLATANIAAARLFEAAGFMRTLDIRWWKASRVEGGESARIPEPAEARRLWPAVAASPGIGLYNAVSADISGARDLDAAELERLSRTGMLRVGPGGRVIAGMRETRSDAISVALLAGRGGALRELLMALRFEADADGLDHVTIALPRDHPASGDLRASGYDFANDDDTTYIYGLGLQ